MLSRYNPIEIEAALRATPPSPPFPPVEERAAWNAVGQRLGAPAVAALIQRAEGLARLDVPSLPATLWLEFQRTGERSGYETPAALRRSRLWALTVAECLQNEDRFLDPILDLAWATCEESSWAYPAHQAPLTDVHRPYLDLGVAGTALTLAELSALLGSKLEPGLTQRIRDELDHRCFTPYLTRHDHWWLFRPPDDDASDHRINNWTAVCNSGIVGAALYLEPDPARLAEMIARAARSLDDYLDTFDPDGGSSEGPGYWGYGFGHYVMLSHLIEVRTGGRVDFLAGERLRKIAAYPLRTLLRRGVYVNFSDCEPDVSLEPALLHYLGNRLDLPDLHGLALAQRDIPSHREYFDWGLRSLFWLPETKSVETTASDTYTPAQHDWFGGMEWMLARFDPSDADAPVLAAKGGHNDEMHNQNDVGSFIVHVHGESLVADPGSGRYTKAYFGPERYDFFVNSSLGHSVPVPNGQLQAEGREFRAVLLDHAANDAQDTLHLELKDAYPAAARLRWLRRRITLHRATEPHAPGGWVELEDRVGFDGAPGAFETALITFNDVDVGANGVIVRGIRGALRVGFDPETVDVRVDLHADVDFSHGPVDVQRIVFALKEPAVEATVRLEMVPLHTGSQLTHGGRNQSQG